VAIRRVAAQTPLADKVVPMSNKGRRRHVFGPVASRRLGRSLGVDPVPFKTCSFNCIYCECGVTTNLTRVRAEYIPVDEIIEDIRDALAHGPSPDYVTFAGSGEPTLHSRLGEMISGIRRITDARIAILTNGSLFYDADVRRDCALADLVIPSIDVGTQEHFAQINRPAAGITLKGLVAGIEQFASEYKGELWLEVFFVAGMNTGEDEIARIVEFARRIHPDKIQLNTAVRPTAEINAPPVADDQLAKYAELFDPPAEVIASVKIDTDAEFLGGETQVYELIQRRPCTLEDIAKGLGIRPVEAEKALRSLGARGLLETVQRDGHEFFLGKIT